MNLILIALLTLVAMPASAGRHGEQDAVFQARRNGALALRAIESGIVPEMRQRGADYIGAEYDPPMGRYRLKFMRGGTVIWVDVDGRTGTVLGRAGE